jgi:Ca2+-binding EF-hand superfamily protein
LKHSGAEIKAENYSSAYSSWKFENPQEIDQREKSVDEKFVLLEELEKTKRKILEQDLATEIEKERLRLEFAHLANEFQRWTKEEVENLAVHHFGFTLEEVEAHQSVLASSDVDIRNRGDSKKHEYESVHNQLNQFGVKQNVYTTLTVSDLGKSRDRLEKAIGERNQAFQKELERQRFNDNLCLQFKNTAQPLIDFIEKEKEIITNSTADLEEQLKHVLQKISTQEKDGASLDKINKLDAEIESHGITNNRHTKLTAKDVNVIWGQYTLFLGKKQAMLINEIERNKLRGITQEQFNEIESNFKSFDTNNNGSIDKKELKACLYSLGEEKSRSEVEKILKDFGDGTKINYNGFKELMIQTLGVSDTKDDIINSFNLINKGDVATVEKMEPIMDQPDIDYVVATAPKTGSGYDYKSWTEDIFSR